LDDKQRRKEMRKQELVGSYDYLRMGLAIHEASHVLFFRVKGVGVKEVWIREDVSLGEPMGMVVSEPPIPNADGCVTNYLTWDEDAISAYMGQQGEKEFGFNTLGWDGDDSEADKAIRAKIKHERRERLGLPIAEWYVKPRTYAARLEYRRKLRVTKDEVAPHRKGLLAKAARLVRKHRDYIEEVATILYKKGQLIGEEIPNL
jgi:hypothetical protein